VLRGSLQQQQQQQQQQSTQGMKECEATVIKV
jgi:hypothetical protein